MGRARLIEQRQGTYKEGWMEAVSFQDDPSNIYNLLRKNPSLCIPRALPPAKKKAASRRKRRRVNETVLDNALTGAEMLHFTNGLYSKSQAMFAVLEGDAASTSELHSTNVLALCLKQFYAVLAHECEPTANRFGVLQLTRDHWTMNQFDDKDGKKWYQACFVDLSLPLESRRISEGLMPSWFKKSRPWTMEEAGKCVPPKFRQFTAKEASIHKEGKASKALLFESVELALRMEAAFCLERLFGVIKKHWYELKIEEDLIQQLLARVPSTTKIIGTGAGGANGIAAAP